MSDMTLLKQLMEMTRDDFSGLRSIASRMFNEYGLRVIIVPHFFDRSITRDAAVTLQDITSALQKFKTKSHNKILFARKNKMAGDLILKDLSTDTNIVFRLDFETNTLVLKTVMRKSADQFVTSQKLGGSEVFVEGFSELFA